MVPSVAPCSASPARLAPLPSHGAPAAPRTRAARRFLRSAATILSLLAGISPARAESGIAPVRAQRLSQAVIVDGVLDEPVWQAAPGIGGLTQSEPTEGGTATQRTAVWIAYDDEALYVAARLDDAHPDSIVANLVRRDLMVASDRFTVYLDTSHDRRSGYFFSVSAAGVLWDGTLSNDDDSDGTWDGVWEGRAHRDAHGWSCELRIPFTQLRYPAGRDQLWGINVSRRIERRAELDQLVYRPKSGSGFVSRFPDLLGLSVERASRGVELLPYATNKAEFLVHSPGDPFNDGSRQEPAIGGDARVAVGNNLTLNATVNPDFGQVEVDPAVVNLSDVESFFEEKRPFFTENASVFSYGHQGGNAYPSFAWAEPTFFYSRRIGRAPEGGVPANADFADVPIATRILGAGKLTGKLSPHLDFGSLLAVTAREDAKYAIGSTHAEAEVEPLAVYGVARTLSQFHEASSGLGAMATVVERRLDGSNLGGALDREGLFGGLDGWHFFDRNRAWVLTGWVSGSRVAGSTERMIEVQSSPQRYMQRPDARRVSVDSSATSLTGIGSRLWLNKQQGNVVFNASLGYMSPTFEINDAGYQQFADEISMHVRSGYHFSTTNAWRKDALLTSTLFRTYNADHDMLNAGLYSVGSVTFANDVSGNVTWWDCPLTYNPRRARGGPVMKELPGNYYAVNLSTPDRGRTVWTLHGDRIYTPDAGGTDYWNVSLAAQWKPVSNLSVQIGPSLGRVVEDAQYVTTVVDPTQTTPGMGERRYVFARMYQTTVAADLRFDITLSPKLSLQTFLQPLVSAASYGGYKELLAPRTFSFIRYGVDGSSTWDPATGVADPDGAGPAAPIAIGDPSFDLRSLRGSAVLRWEYLPGSSLFFVWTQDRSGQGTQGAFRLSDSMQELFAQHASDVLLVKVTYYIPM